jgi:hypothetical protein
MIFRGCLFFKALKRAAPFVGLNDYHDFFTWRKFKGWQCGGLTCDHFFNPECNAEVTSTPRFGPPLHTRASWVSPPVEAGPRCTLIHPQALGSACTEAPEVGRYPLPSLTQHPAPFV